MVNDPAAPDIWTAMRAATRARIGLGRAGDALPTHAMLDFQFAHARARDAVHSPLDIAALRAQLGGHSMCLVSSQAPDRATYLRRPDLGRRVSPQDLTSLQHADYDAAFILADGLSAVAVNQGAASLIAATYARLENWHMAPITIATQARVAIGDDIAAALGARMSIIVIGERPGLSAADSLGVYLTWRPAPGCLDSARNCISNIHPNGLSIDSAADRLAWLMTRSRALKLSGIGLKDNSHMALQIPDAPLLPGTQE